MGAGWQCERLGDWHLAGGLGGGRLRTTVLSNIERTCKGPGPAMNCLFLMLGTSAITRRVPSSHYFISLNRDCMKGCAVL